MFSEDILLSKLQLLYEIIQNIQIEESTETSGVRLVSNGMRIGRVMD
jgi:hypothetical protein